MRAILPVLIPFGLLLITFIVSLFPRKGNTREALHIDERAERITLK